MTANNQTQKNGSQAIKAAKIGFVCIFTYVMSYYVRNILSVLKPEMQDNGIDEAYIAFLGSVYMIVYAAGQLVNGIIGDHIKPKYMVSLGLTVTSAGLFAFTFFGSGIIGILSFGVIGFGLSMLRGPLVKVISENTLPKYARLCCVFLSFASFAGPIIASVVSIVLKWNAVFLFSGFAMLAMAVFSFIALTFFEKNGMIKPIQKAEDKQKKEKFDLMTLFKLPNFIPYLLVAMVVEIAAASINQWMTSFFNESLGMSETLAKSVFSVVGVLRALCPFISLFIFKLFKERDILILRIFFSASALLLISVVFIENAWIAVVIYTLALMCCSVSSATLWSIYIPSLGKSGKVSSANGVIDCTGYIGAAVFNMIVVPIKGSFGWDGTVISWSCVMILGVLSTLFAKNNKESE